MALDAREKGCPQMHLYEGERHRRQSVAAQLEPFIYCVNFSHAAHQEVLVPLRPLDGPAALRFRN
eukprot:6214546-Pleurochrysis_carterae.AAC.3